MKGRVSYKLVLNGKGYFIIFLIICYEIYLSYGYGIFRLWNWFNMVLLSCERCFGCIGGDIVDKKK